MKKLYLLPIMAALVLTGCPGTTGTGEGEDTKKSYDITFKNYDGTVLQSSKVEENTLPVYTGATPTKPNDSSCSYTFKGWEPKIVAATANANYVAAYSSTALKAKYDITFKNYDGTELQKITVEEGSIPEYTGTTPTKPDSGDTKYTFDGWTPTIVAATSAATYTAVFKESKEYGVKTIAEVRELCKSIKNLNVANIGVDMTQKVTIRGLAIAQTDLVKTTKKYGYDVSEPGKTFFADSTGIIACASKVSVSGGTTLYSKVSSYIGQSTTKYEITGYLSIYMNQPEIYVENEYKFDKNLDVTVNIDACCKETISLTKFYEKAVASNYNCSGHGYDDVYKINKLKVIDHRDSVYVCSDGEKMIKVLGNTTILLVGKTYDITGMISLQNWVPALRTLKATISSEEAPELVKEKAVATTMTDFRKIKGEKDDTDRRQDNFINSFAYLYKANVYASAYQEGGNIYITVSDKFDKSKEIVTGDEVAVAPPYEMVAISNDNYWKIDERQMENYCPIRYWLFEEETFEFYFVPFLQEFRTYSKTVYPLWKVFAINSMLPEAPVA